MEHCSVETDRGARGPLFAWLTFGIVSATVAYFELINHRAITSWDFAGPFAHALFFASLALSAFAVLGRGLPLFLVAGTLSLAAAVLEVVEVIPTAPGSLLHWMFSLCGIWLAWLGTRTLGLPRSDVGMATAALLWCGGLLAALIG